VDQRGERIMPLNAKIDAERLRNLYMDTKETVSILLTGESGHGKTYLAKTAPFPVLMDSFDPGGTLSVRDEIHKGNIIPTNFESEDPYDPEVFLRWERTFNERVKDNYFASFACYWLDSATWWIDCILAAILKKAGRPGQAPKWQSDWYPNKIILQNYIRKCQNLPCHFILTAHLLPQKDQEGNILCWRPNFSGQAQVVVPTMFDEIWLMDRKEKSSGFDYTIRTQASGMYNARSRLAGAAHIEKVEPANLRAILKKAGVNSMDKPRLLEKI
jgi:AAA domain